MDGPHPFVASRWALSEKALGDARHETGASRAHDDEDERDPMCVAVVLRLPQGGKSKANYCEVSVFEPSSNFLSIKSQYVPPTSGDGLPSVLSIVKDGGFWVSLSHVKSVLKTKRAANGAP